MRTHSDPLHGAVQRAARPARMLRVVDLADTEAGGDTPMTTPHWGIHTGDWPARRCDLPYRLPERAQAAQLIGDGSEPRPWPVRTPDQQRAECQRQRFAGRLEGAFVGACIVIAAVIGGCAWIAALEREDARGEPMPVAPMEAPTPIPSPGPRSGGPISAA